jgi:hypothetical protein
MTNNDETWDASDATQYMCLRQTNVLVTVMPSFTLKDIFSITINQNGDGYVTFIYIENTHAKAFPYQVIIFLKPIMLVIYQKDTKKLNNAVKLLE